MPGVETSPYGKLVLLLNKDMRDCTPIRTLAHKLNLQPADLVIMWWLTLCVIGILNLYNHTLVTLLGSLYPSYMTFKVHQLITHTLRIFDTQQCRKWLTYWIVFGFVTAADRPLSQFLFMVPGYYTLKMMLLVGMMEPRVDLVGKVYELVVRKGLRRFRSFSRPGFVNGDY